MDQDKLGVIMIYAFDHEHKVGDECNREKCEDARRAPVLCGDDVFEDLPMIILKEATAQEYLDQPLEEGSTLPPLVYGCSYIYKVFIETTPVSSPQ